MTRLPIVLATAVLVVLLPNWLAAQTADDSTASQRIAAATEKLANKQKFQLRYQFKPGEQIRWKVEHVATTKTQIAGTNENTSSRTQSIKVWKVKHVDNIGNITFEHSVESTSLWQKIGENEPIAYDSKVDKEAPEQFASAEEMIGKPLAEVTISPTGKIVRRDSEKSQINFGVGDLCTPLPEQPVPVGHRWFVPTEFDAVDDDGKRLKLKARINYQLAKITDGAAIISFRSEVLTPIENDKIRSQLLQKLNDGYVAIDLNKGRLVSKEVLWNEKVQEYAGADSFLHYIGRMTEDIVVSNPIQPQPQIVKPVSGSIGAKMHK